MLCVIFLTAAFFMSNLSVHRTLIERIVDEFESKHQELEHLGDYLQSARVIDAIRYFTHSNQASSFQVPALNISSTSCAIEKLKKEYWHKVVVDTGVFHTLPAARRAEWTQQLNRELPPFTEVNVTSTLKDLMLNHDKFFAERVDGIFKALSGSHVTNEPQGFSKRMIFESLYKCVAALTDLRIVVSELFKRKSAITENMTRKNLEFAHNTAPGKWMICDGGIFRFRVYKKSTVHVEIHPHVAWKLNEYLALLYPMAIPPAVRKRTHSEKFLPVIFDLVPSEIIHLLSLSRNALSVDESRVNNVTRIENTIYVDGKLFKEMPNSIQRQYHAIMDSLNGSLIRAKNFNNTYYEYYKFEYDVKPVIAHILLTGQLPNQQSFQYYPTTCERLQETVLEYAELEPHHKKLEPSAGSGHLAERMGLDTVCVELSATRCEILSSKGFKEVYCENFLSFALRVNTKFDRIIMNPPFADGRALQHVRLACHLLAPGGTLTAIVPVNFDGSSIDNVRISKESLPFKNAFVGTGIVVKVICIELVI
jgi:hypothetical protein